MVLQCTLRDKVMQALDQHSERPEEPKRLGAAPGVWTNASGAPKTMRFDADLETAQVGMDTDEVSARGLRVWRLLRLC